MLETAPVEIDAAATASVACFFLNAYCSKQQADGLCSHTSVAFVRGDFVRGLVHYKHSAMTADTT